MSLSCHRVSSRSFVFGPIVLAWNCDGGKKEGNRTSIDGTANESEFPASNGIIDFADS